MFSTWSSRHYPPAAVGTAALYRDEYKDPNMELRVDLEENFRPVFQQFVYGGERIALHDLRRLLENRWYRRMLPPDKVHDLLDLADFNPGQAISYDEFTSIVLGEKRLKSTGGSSIGVGSRVSESKTRARSEGTLYYLCKNTIPNIELGEYLYKYRCCPPPFFMISLSIVQIVLFCVTAFELDKDGIPTTALEGFDINSTLIYKPTRRYEAWRFVTYIFYHQGYMHLIFTLVFQLIFGIPLEIVFKFWRLMIVYFMGAITGSLLQSISDHYVVMLGGSGGIYAIMTAHLLSFIFNWSELKKDSTGSSAMKCLCNLPLRIILIILIAAVDIGLAVYRRFYLDDPYKVGLCAHGGGILAGFFLAKPFLRDIQRYPWQQNSGWMACFMFFALVGGAVVFNVAFKGYPPTDWS
ncbi:hypothetical protein LOTGIDRAFT_230028 [Lottia gigantea]|uniref:Peptidase S54 rhomboid domain-containing protein n=1 Tax=Lottia gigantea TaxID=225164 RepID=V4B3M7_LOTGI|nr:hypothetical protein LOTGIDRAFT_230028 [Lottia gigantea]ESP04973.1 hypothetical protein LOTGIDRAFT_230028 [Lottia gigantea]